MEKKKIESFYYMSGKSRYTLWLKLIKWCLSLFLICQDVVWAGGGDALAPQSLFTLKNRPGDSAGTKVGTDQSPVPVDVVTKFIDWAKAKGAVVIDVEDGIKVIKGLESLELIKFRERGYAIKMIANSITFTNRGEGGSDAYFLRDRDGNVYITEKFYEHYREAPPFVKSQELMHEVFEHEWSSGQIGGQEDIDSLWERVFRRMEELGQKLDDGERDVYKKVFSKANIEGFLHAPVQDTAHVLAELTEKLGTLIYGTKERGEDIHGLGSMDLNTVNKKIDKSNLDRFLDNIDMLPIRDALVMFIDAVLRDEPSVFSKIFIEFLQKSNKDNLAGVLDLAVLSVLVFMGEWDMGRYPSIRKEDLPCLIEKIINRWMGWYKTLGIEGLKNEKKQVTGHFSAWEDSCKAVDVLIAGRKCYISFNILNRKSRVEFYIPGKGEIISVVFGEFRFRGKCDTFLIEKLKVLKGESNLEAALQNPACRTCIQEIIDELGWETALQVFNKNKDFLGVTDEEMGRFLGKMQEEGFPCKDVVLKCAYPRFETEFCSEGIVPSVYITKPVSEDLLKDAVSVLEFAGDINPRLKDVLTGSLLERIRRGKVVFGKHFGRVAAALEAGGEGERDYFIAMNHYLEPALSLDNSMRGIFLASILLGQEAQIYLRSKKGANWDDPEFNSAFIAQAAELQILNLYRHHKEFKEGYSSYLDSLASNCWGEVNLADMLAIHRNFLEEGLDYNFLEAKIDTMFMYQEMLRSLALLSFSQNSLGAASVNRIIELLKEMGIMLFPKFSGVPPAERVSVNIRYRDGVNKGSMIREERLVSLVRDAFIPQNKGKSGLFQNVGDIIDKGVFSCLVIEVDPNAKKVTARLDIQTMELFVTVPELKDEGAWGSYCDKTSLFLGREDYVIYTDVFDVLFREERRNHEAIENAKRYMQKGNPGMALMDIRRRSKLNPKDFELICCSVEDILMPMGDFYGAQEIIHAALLDPGLYTINGRHYLLRLIHLAIRAERMKPKSTKHILYSVGDMLYLADIAKKEFKKQMDAINIYREGAKETLAAMQEGSVRGEGGVGGESLSGIAHGLDFAEREARKFMGLIESEIYNLCIYRGHFTAAQEWAGGQIKDAEVFERERLLSKALISFAKGEPLTEEEIGRFFKFYEERQKQNPIDFNNVSSWGFYLYMFWRYKYPSRREFLEEAERRCEQYNVLCPSSRTAVNDHTYYLGLIKFHLGKTDDSFVYLNQFFKYSPEYMTRRNAYIEGRILFKKLKKEREEKKELETLIVRRRLEAGPDALSDLINNYMDPFIASGRLAVFLPEETSRFKYLYLDFIRNTNDLEKAYRQARDWLEGEPNMDIDIIGELAKIGALLGKDDEVLEFLQGKLAGKREKDIILDYVNILVLIERGKLADALKASDFCVRKYGPQAGRGIDRERAKIFANILRERSYIYVHLGQFMSAKRVWEYIKKHGLKQAHVYETNIANTDILEDATNLLVSKVYDELSLEQYPDIMVERFNEILEMYPHNRKALRARNSIISNEGRFDEVEREYLSLLEIYPESIEFRLDLAFCALSAGSPKALEYYKEFQRAGGDINPVRDQVGIACIMADRWDEAIEHFKVYIRKTQDKRDILADIYIRMAVCYEQLGRWDEAYNLLTLQFAEKYIKESPTAIRKRAAELQLACCHRLLAREKPDWARIETIRALSLKWAEGMGLEKHVEKLESDIASRRKTLEEEEADRQKTTDAQQRKSRLRRQMERLREKVRELKEKVMEEDRLKTLEDNIGQIIGSLESCEEADVLEQLDRIRSEVPDALEIARGRIQDRKRAIEALKKRIEDAIRDLDEGRETDEEAIPTGLLRNDREARNDDLSAEAERLDVRRRSDIAGLLDELNLAKEKARMERRRKERERILAGLNEQFDDVEKEIEGLIERLHALSPREKPQPILDECGGILAKFLDVQSIGNLRDTLEKKKWPEEFTERIKSAHSRFMGIFYQVKERSKKAVKQAFDSEIEDALSEMETIPIPKNGSVIARRREIHDLLMKPVLRVLEKYSRIGFKIKYSARMRIMQQAEERISLLISRLEEEEEEMEDAGEAERAEEEERRIQELIRRQEIIRKAADMWAAAVRNELGTKSSRSDVDFELIRAKGEELARVLEEDGVFLTYEEAFGIQNEIFLFLNPNPRKARFSWEKVYPALLAISMNKRDSARAEKEVNECFKRPEIEEIDREIYRILNGPDVPEHILEYMKSPSSAIRKEISIEGFPSDIVKRFWAYWHTANNGPKETRDWCKRFGRIQELQRLGVVEGPEEVVMAQINLLRKIYTDDPENNLDTESPDYAVRIAEIISAEFSGKTSDGKKLKDQREFLYRLENSRLKLVPRQEPRDDSLINEDDEVSWIRENLGMHRHLTACETRDLILLAQKGNPVAMNVLKMAHAITVVREARTYAKETSSFANVEEYINNGFLGFSMAVLRYGYVSDNTGRRKRVDKHFGLHLIKPNFLQWVRLPVRNLIERSARRQSADVTEAFWVEDAKQILARARAQVYRDINTMKGFIGLLEKDGGKLRKARKDITNETVLEIAKITGLKPLQVVAFIVDCPFSDLCRAAQDGLARELGFQGDAYPESLKTIAQFLGMTPMQALVDNLNIQLTPDRVKVCMDKVFSEILQEKNEEWRRNSADIRPLFSVLLGKQASTEVLQEIWWIERRIGKDLEKEDLEEIYLGYFEKLYDSIAEAGSTSVSNSDIASAVEYIINVTPDRQNKLDRTGVSGIKSRDEPVGGDMDDKTTVGERIDLSSFVHQRTPEEEASYRLRLMKIRPKVLGMLDRLAERRLGERKSELETLRPQWRKKLAELEASRGRIGMASSLLETTRREKAEELRPLEEQMDEIKKRYDARLAELLARHEKERSELSASQERELERADAEKVFTRQEKTAHLAGLKREVNENIDREVQDIEKAHAEILGMIEKGKEIERVEITRGYQDAIGRLNSEVQRLRDKHAGEIAREKREAEPDKIEGNYPVFPDWVRPKMQTVEFDKEFWELILKTMDYIPAQELLNELAKVEGTGLLRLRLAMTETGVEIEIDSEKARGFHRLLKQLIEECQSCEFHQTKLICAVFVPLCFDERLWDLIDENSDLELKAINARLNIIIKGQRAELYGFTDYGKEEAGIFSAQVVILIKIVEKYRKFLERQKRGDAAVNLDEKMRRHEEELKDLQELIDCKRRVEEFRYETLLEIIKGEKKDKIKEAERERDKLIAEAEKNREEGLAKAKVRHKEWLESSGRDAVNVDYGFRLEQLSARHADEKKTLETVKRMELEPVEKEYNAKLAGIEKRIEGELNELAAAISSAEEEQEGVRHDAEQVSMAVREEREAIEQGTTPSDIALREKHHAEWEEFAGRFNKQRKGSISLNGYLHWNFEIIEAALKELLGKAKRAKNNEKRKRIERYLVFARQIAKRQAEEESELKERQEKRLEELDREKTVLNEQLTRSIEEISAMRKRAGDLSEWLDRERIMLGKLETDFELLDRKYRELEQERRRFERAKSMYLDRKGLSETALKSWEPMKLDEIARDKRYIDPEDGTALARERVRQIVKWIDMQLMVFSDLDEEPIENLPFFKEPQDMTKLLLRLKMTRVEAEDTDTDIDTEDTEIWGKFYISREELLQLVRTIIEAQDRNTSVKRSVADKCLEIIRLFITKNQIAGADTYKITASIAQQVIFAVSTGKGILRDFEERIGEMRIKLLLEKQMGSPLKVLKPYTVRLDNVLTSLERRFEDDYEPQDEFPWFPTTDKRWLSRDELIRLGLTWRSNKQARKRIGALLRRFIEEQREYYPDSTAGEAVRELTGLDIGETASSAVEDSDREVEERSFTGSV